MAHVQTYSRLALATLTAEQHGRTCGYWYTVTDYGTPHTAFRTRAALEAWLALAGLELSADLPAEGVHSYQSLLGSYRTALTMDRAEFWALEGARFRSLSNGQYTLGVATVEAADVETGTRTLWTLNPNVPRPLYDYRQSCGAIDAGDWCVDSLPISGARFYVLGRGLEAGAAAMVLDLEGMAERRQATGAIAWQNQPRPCENYRWDIAERIGPDLFRTEAGEVVRGTQSPYTAAAWGAFVDGWQDSPFMTPAAARAAVLATAGER